MVFGKVMVKYGTNEAGTINLYGDGTYAPTLGSYGGLNGGGADANFGQNPSSIHHLMVSNH